MSAFFGFLGKRLMKHDITLSTCAFTANTADEAALIRHFEMAMEAGFAGFELAITKREDAPVLLSAACKTAAPVVAVHGVLDARSCSPDAAVRREAAEAAFSYLEVFAGYAPCPIVEHYFHRFNDPEIGKYFRDSVEMLLEKTEKAGFVFCMENAPYKPEYDERFPNVAEIVEFVRSFGENRMFMTFDVNHANLHEDPVAVCRTSAGLVKHIHVSDNHGHREEHLLPGAGTIDLRSVIFALYANGYNGPCNLEVIFPRGVQADTAAYAEVYRTISGIIGE